MLTVRSLEVIHAPSHNLEPMIHLATPRAMAACLTGHFLAGSSKAPDPLILHSNNKLSRIELNEPPVGIDPTTLRLRSACSAKRAIEAMHVSKVI